VTPQAVAAKQLGILDAALAANPSSEELLLVLMTQVLPSVRPSALLKSSCIHLRVALLQSSSIHSHSHKMLLAFLLNYEAPKNSAILEIDRLAP
jgi:hypothetical protein